MGIGIEFYIGLHKDSMSVLDIAQICPVQRRVSQLADGAPTPEAQRTRLQENLQEVIPVLLKLQHRFRVQDGFPVLGSLGVAV